MTNKNAYWSIAIVSIISLVSISQLPNLQFNFDFDDFFEMSDSNWIAYQEHVAEFGHDNDYLLVAIENSNGLFNPVLLNKVDSLVRLFKNIDGVSKILSPLSAQKIIQAPFGIVLVPYLHKDDSQRLKRDSLQLGSHPNLVEKLINSEVRALALIVYHKRFADKTLEDKLSKAINQTLKDFEFDDYHIAGRIQAQSVFIKLIRENFTTFLVLSISLIICILYLLFRRVKWVIIPIIIISLSLAISLSVMVISNQAIDILSSMLPTILLVTAMSDITHFLTRYLDLCSKGFEKTEAVNVSFKEVGVATFLTSITTAIGFMTLILTDSMPVKNLGIYTAVGVMITYAVTFSLLPATALLSETQRVTKTSNWEKILKKAFFLTFRSYKKVLVIYTILAIIAVICLKELVIDTPLIADFPREHKVTRDFMFFDQHFGGSKPLEIHIEINDPKKNLLSKDVINEIDKVVRFLEGKFDNLASPDDIIKTLNMANHGGQPEYYELPTEKDYGKIVRQFPQVAHHFPMRLTSNDKRRGRITGFSKDLGSKAGLYFQKEFEKFIANEIDPNLMSFKLTGTSYLFDLTTEALVDNIIYGLIIAIATVALIMAAFFRSLKMILITLIPNILPLLFLAALMAIFEIPLRLSTSIIFAIAFGIAVDDTIHFLTRFHLESKRSSSQIRALLQTFVSTGKAMIITTFILSSGFIIFTFSSFDATFYTGLLISITLVVALIVDLTLLPVLLLLLMKKKNVRPV